MDISDLEPLRSKEELSELLHLAKIDKSDLCNLTQIIYAEKQKDFSNKKLIELDKKLLEAVQLGDSLSFRGETGEFVVLCTKDRTYDVREAETSNSLLLVPNLKFHTEIIDSESNNRSIEDLEVKGNFASYLEVREIKPRFNKLTQILGETAFRGIEYEKGIDKEKLFDWDKLRSKIQASDEELKQALPQYSIVNIDGYYRLVSFDYEADAVSKMVDLITYNSWEIDEVDREESLEALHELIPEPVFNALFDKYTEIAKQREDPTGNPNASEKSKTTPLYRYNEEKLCKMLAKVLLAVSPVTEYTGFMDAWETGVPEGMKPKEECLYGLAVVKMNNEIGRREIVSFPEEHLPENVEKRFEELFKVKDKWTLEEITPYISNVATEKLNVKALLTKYARSSMKNGIKYYSSKHGK
ncbi:sister chromatid cohesion protein DCC1 [Belonocnema kinseyi]|uniref:sister chromatid cohesion protein DCC1 n=1 Tax=Belonocnema kinseyi TaxID=2817044 RepID=UPI00143D8FA7|nr:sister chromatid cohesion protein DCC1 [Belonocnema kinseyi]